MLAFGYAGEAGVLEHGVASSLACVDKDAAVRYMYMCEYWMQVHKFVYRLVDLSITVPLQSMELDLILMREIDGCTHGRIAVVVAPQWQDPGDALLRPCWQDWSA